MSGGITATMVMAGAAVVGTAYSIYSGQKAASSAKDAQAQAQANANQQLSQAQQAERRANQKNPDTMSMLDAAKQAGRAGASGTMLTGPQGVGSDTLSLSKNTLLGG